MANTLRIRREGGIALAIGRRGATWLSCEVPVAGGMRHVILRRDGLTEAQADSAYLGATIGRYANRIRDARIRHGDGQWALLPNPGSRHQLHGGPGGFHTREWDAAQTDASEVRLRLRSEAGDQGYPGTVEAEVVYRLVDAMTLEMEATAQVDAPCPLALTNHAYFDLDGNAADVRGHRLRIAASHYMPVDGDLLPLGPPAPVAGTSFDFREPKTIREDWLGDAQQARAGGYDHAFLLDRDRGAEMRPACELTSSASDLRLSIDTTLPALQFYGGQYLARAGHAACAAVALEPGFLPDSPNHPEWPQPSCWVMPGQPYRHLIRWRFEAA